MCLYISIGIPGLQDGILYKLANFCLYKTKNLAIYTISTLTCSRSCARMKLLGGSLGAAPFLFQIDKQYADVCRADPGNPPRLTYGNRPDGAELFLGLQPQTGDGAIVHVLGDFPGFLPLEFRHLLFLPSQVSRVFQLNFHFLRHGLRKLRPLPVKGGDVLVAHLGAANQIGKSGRAGDGSGAFGLQHGVQLFAGGYAAAFQTGNFPAHPVILFLHRPEGSGVAACEELNAMLEAKGDVYKRQMIRQIFAEMSDAELSKAAFIQITAKDTLADVNRDLKQLEAQGFRYVFLDEMTLMEDFIEGAALFSDVFAACGMKIVLSGTDSLGFLFTEDEQLYDRCILLHTTFIPYREFESVLGVHGIDEYIRYGGTMSLGGVHYNETSTFASKESTDEYVDTAIARKMCIRDRFKAVLSSHHIAPFVFAMTTDKHVIDVLQGYTDESPWLSACLLYTSRCV